MKSLKEKTLLKKNKGLSEVVATVVIIMLVIVSAAIIWGVVNNFINKKTEGVKSCFDIGFSGQVSFNGEYTCYDSANSEVQFSINIGDVDIEKATITIFAGGSSKSIGITNGATIISGIYNYPDRTTSIILPGKNSGLTYIVTGINTAPEWIKIAPHVEGKQCDVAETIYELEDCALFE